MLKWDTTWGHFRGIQIFLEEAGTSGGQVLLLSFPYTRRGGLAQEAGTHSLMACGFLFLCVVARNPHPRGGAALLRMPKKSLCP